ncbi:hypothetical protein BASA81_010767 [Batrachochytrium salamandrivorans]|nr:hypothetical protein BASA81_010767 [Batrachochytrium salamandrivorans]
MGCVHAVPLSEQRVNWEIEREQSSARRELENQIELFVVGSGNSGKTTLVKQLTCISSPHSQYASAEYRREAFVTVIHANLYDGVFALLYAFPNQLAITNEEMEMLSEGYQRHRLPPSCAKRMIAILNQYSALALGNDPNLQDCFLVFAQKLVEGYPQWGGEEIEWTPTIEDCIRARVRTTGVTKQTIHFRDTTFHLVDVGGQKAERRKWLHTFDTVDKLLFVCAASEYDQEMYEEANKNRLLDSLELFQEVANMECFAQKPFLLLLNKQDLFEEKISRVPLSASGIPGAPTELVPLAAAIRKTFARYLSHVGK